MSASIFTYYTKNVAEQFLSNISSLIAKSDQSYDTIVICSLDPIPNKINRELYKTHRVIRVYPEIKGQAMLERYLAGERFLMHPFLLSAVSYAGSDIVTVFDSSLYILNRLPAYAGTNLFYKNHAGLVSPTLFTINTNSFVRTAFTTVLSESDFADQICLNRFAYLVTNAMPLKPCSVSSSRFVFSNPGDSDPIVTEKLAALDFSNLEMSRDIYKKMLAVKNQSIPKVNLLTRVTDQFTKRITLSSKSGDFSAPLTSSVANPYYRILFKYTSRSRPDLFYRGLCSIFDNCDSSNFVVLCSLDEDDPALPAYKKLLTNFPERNIRVEYGQSKNKIDAINRDLNQYVGRWDILVNMSDDMIFTEYGFDQVIRRAFGDSLDQFVHFNDGLQRENLCSMTIEGRAYYERFNYIYYPSYVSLWCDLEAQEVAKRLGKYKYLGDDLNILKHLHPSAGLSAFDEQYRKTEDPAVSSIDRRNYENRKRLGFPANRITVDIPQPVFSILIASIEKRQSMFFALLEELCSQINEFDGMCEILWEVDEGSKTTGEKRNTLLKRARGKYLAFFDDDDWPSNNYAKSILNAVESDPDCCSLLGEMTTDGMNPEIFEHSLKYLEWRTASASKVRYERNPNHLNPIRSSIAKTIKFPEINHGEDKAWSDRLKESGLLQKEATVQDIIYYYRYISKK